MQLSIVMLPWVFCPGFASCMQTMFRLLQSCSNVSVLSTAVNSFFGYLLKMGIAAGMRFRHSDIGNYCMVCASRAYCSLS